MLIYVFINIFLKVKVVRNNFDEFNFLFNFLIFNSTFTFYLQNRYYKLISSN